MRSAWTTVIVFILFVPSVLGQQPAGVELRIDARTLEEGESIDAQLICTNTGDPESPQFIPPDGLDLRLVSSTPARSSMVSIVNGRRSDTTTITYAFRLTARKAGNYTLGPFEVAAGGTTYATNPIPLVVRKSAPDTQRDGDRLVFARISVQPVSLYVTQNLEATLTFAIRKVESEGRPIDVGNLLQFVDGGGSDLSVFGTRFTPSETTLVDSAGNRHSYVVYRQTRDIRAEQVGTMSIGPVFLKVNYPVSLRRSWLGGLEAAESRREIARAEAITVEVKAPPTEGRPADFTGAIGSYSLNALVKPTNVELGQPVTLTIVIKGQPLEGVAGPNLSRFPDLVSRFDFTKDELTGDIEAQARVFRRAIFPKQIGEQTIPPITWSYFDPATQQYVSLATQPIPIVVNPSSSPMSLSDSTNRTNHASPTSLTPLSGGISPNYVEANVVLANQSWLAGPTALAGSLAAPPILCFLAALIARRRERLRTDPNYGRRLGATRKARARISRALRACDPAAQWQGLADVLTGFLSDRFGLPPGELTPNDVRLLLRIRPPVADIAEEVAAFLETRDAVRFAPGMTEGTTAADAAARVHQWIARIDKSP